MRIQRDKNQQIKKPQYTERIARLAIIFTAFGGIFFISKSLIKNMITIFTARIYVAFPFSLDHFLSVSFITSALIFLVSISWYCITELRGLVFTGSQKHLLTKMAEESFNDIFRSTYFSIIAICTIFFVCVYTLFSIAIVKFNILFIIIVIISLLIILSVFVFKKPRRKLVSLLRPWFVANKKYLYAWTGLYFISFLVMLVILDLSTFPKSTQLQFSNDVKQPIEFRFDNGIPESINVGFYTDQTLNKEIRIMKDEFLGSFVEVSSKNEKTTLLNVLDNAINSPSYNLNSTNYKYSYILKTSESFYKKGKNSIMIIFEFGEGDNKTHYKIRNDVFLNENGTLDINRKEFEFKL